MSASKRAIKGRLPKTTGTYQHPEADSPMRPEVGTQAQFRKKKPPQTYRYDSSLSPALEWDGQNPAREAGEALIKEIADGGLRLAELAKAPATPTRDREISILKSQISDCQSRLRRISGAFLNWTGKAERLSFDVPTLPLFIHERLSTKAIIETLQGHKTDKQEDFFRELWGDPQHSVTDQVLRAYEYRDDWVNRMMLGDSLVVMNSLLRYESMGGQVQMIYIDPPYGVKFGSNFQPFVRKRDVGHNDDADMTREPEMVQAYRDTWELGLHSYLTYLRDRLLLARELLHPSGSIFVQISDENLHHVREVMDEVFGAENFISVITFRKTGGEGGTFLGTTCDFLLWYSKDRSRTKYNQLFQEKKPGDEGAAEYTNVELADGSFRPMSDAEIANPSLLPLKSRIFATWPIVSPGYSEENSKPIKVEYKGSRLTLRCPPNRHWSVGVTGTLKLWEIGRLLPREGQRIFKRYINDFSFTPVSNQWTDTRGEVRATYVVQTSAIIIQRCMLMTTAPGDLILDPTCGSGTTAYVAEQWGRRWITCDTSRVPLALARQRLLTATFPFYELKDEERGPAGGFVYKRKQNKKGEEVGGIVPHITLKSIANNEPAAEEVLVDRPEVKSGIIRVTGPFTFEATIPTPVDWEGDGVEDSGAGTKEDYGSFVDRMLEVLRKSPVLRLEGNRTVQLNNVRPPAKSLSLSAEAIVESGSVSPTSPSSLSSSALAYFKKELLSHTLRFKGEAVPFERIRRDTGVIALHPTVDSELVAFLTEFTKQRKMGVVRISAEDYSSLKQKASQEASTAAERISSDRSAACPVAIVFGPESGAVSEKLVYEAAREAHAKNYTHLYVIGFAIQPNARALVEKCHEVMGVPATYVQATPDLMMGDLLKNMRSSQIFSVCGLPEVKVFKAQGAKVKVDYRTKAETRYQVELLGLDVFDPISMDVDHQSGNEVPAWFLDTDYNGLCFHVSQAFFPRTGAWENLKKALKGDYEESVWDHLAGTISAPFGAGEHGQVAVKVIDQRGNELLVVKSLKEAGR